MPALIERRCKEAGIRHEVFPSVANGDYSFLYHLIQEANVTDVVVAGGDGTLNQTIASLRQFNVRFGIIPCGSGNGLALSAGIPRDPEKAMDVIFAGNDNYIDGFTINSGFACMLCGLGFDAQVAHDFANDPKRGLATYVKQTVKNFFTSKAYTFKIAIGKKEIVTDAFFISVANSNQFGNNFTIAPKASLTDGLLDVVIMTKQNKLSMLLHAARQVTGYNQLQEVDLMNERGSVLYFQTETIKISNPMNAPMHIDGEPVHTESVLRINLIHKCFRLLVPGS